MYAKKVKYFKNAREKDVGVNYEVLEYIFFPIFIVNAHEHIK